jgi:hypothetical protein
METGIPRMDGQLGLLGGKRAQVLSNRAGAHDAG